MRRLVISSVCFSLMALSPLACGGSDETDTSSTGGKGGTGGGSGGSGGGSAGATSGGGSAGTSAGGSAGSAGTSSGGSAGGGGVAGATADGGLSGISGVCTTCATTTCALQMTACLGNGECASCANTDYEAAACKDNAQYKALCGCAAVTGSACHDQCAGFCEGVN